ncbi:MAG: 50S ribosomal protein L25 [Patescibacteria group bacterium]
MTQTISAVQRAQGERQPGRIAAIMYGRGIASQMLSVPFSDFVRVYNAAGQSSLVDVTVGQNQAVKVLIKDVQLHPLTMAPRHIDFYQVRMDEEMTATIPLTFVGESKAVKTDAGTLVKSLDEIEVTCLPANLPHAIEVDLAKLVTFEDVITVADIAMPTGVKAVTASDVTVATVARPLTEDEIKRMEQQGVGDISTVKTEQDEKKAEKAATEAAGKAAEEKK